jgi:hypothetical protein
VTRRKIATIWREVSLLDREYPTICLTSRFHPDLFARARCTKTLLALRIIAKFGAKRIQLLPPAAMVRGARTLARAGK